MTKAGVIAGAVVIAATAWLALPVVAVLAIVRDKLDRLEQLLPPESGPWHT